MDGHFRKKYFHAAMASYLPYVVTQWLKSLIVMAVSYSYHCLCLWFAVIAKKWPQILIYKKAS